MIPGCGADAVAYFGIRLRRPPQGDADWAPNTNTFLCDEHAHMGAQVTIIYAPKEGGAIETHVYAVPGAPVVRETPIVTRVQSGAIWYVRRRSRHQRGVTNKGSVQASPQLAQVVTRGLELEPFATLTRGRK